VPASDGPVQAAAGRWSSLAVGLAAVVAALVDRSAITSGNQLVYPPKPRQWLLVSLMVVITVVITVATGFFRRWLFWRPATNEPSLLAVLNTVLALFVLIEMFVAVTALLASTGTLSVSGFQFIPISPDSAPGSGFSRGSYWGPAGSQIYLSIEALYLWHLLDVIPALDIPETLNWTPAHSLIDHVGGGLVLVFKVLVALPVITLAKNLFTKSEQNNDRADGGSPSRG